MFLNSHRQGLNKLVFVPRFLSARGFTTWPGGPASSQRAGTGRKCHERRTDITQMHASGGSRGNWGKLWWQTISPVQQLLSIQLSTEAHYIQAWNDIWKRLGGGWALHTALCCCHYCRLHWESSPHRAPAPASDRLHLLNTLTELLILDLCTLSMKTQKSDIWRHSAVKCRNDDAPACPHFCNTWNNVHLSVDKSGN